MKKTTTLILLLVLFSFVSFSQTGNYQIRIIENEIGYLEVQMTETTGGVNLPSNTDGDKIGDIAFAIRWSDAIGADVAMLCSNSNYNITEPGGLLTDQTGWYYRYYNASPAPFVVPADWQLGEWQTLATFYVTGSSSTGSFEIAPQDFGSSTLNFTLAELGVPPYYQYLPTINGTVSAYPFPTIIYNYVWNGSGANGGTPSDWAHWANWDTECGGIAGPPNTGSNVYIPGTIGTFPSTNGSGTMACNNLIIGASASLTIPETNGSLVVGGKFKTYGTLTITPNADATITGDTYIESAEGIVVQADATGIGSFINLDVMAYGASGSAEVQIHLAHGTPPSGTFFFHQVGPTVNDPATGFSGVYLEDFNLNDDVNGGNDYAYTYDESVVPVPEPGTWNPWVNIYEYTEPIHTTTGMLISTNTVEQHTIETLVGEIVYGPVESYPLTFSGSHYEMISNPYSSAIDFDLFYANTGNDAVIENKFWIWDASTGNYLANAAAAGTIGPDIQVGQAFFVETLAGGTVDFENSNRTHSLEPFRDMMENKLSLDVASEATSFADGLVIRFDEDASSGYDEAIEAIKFNSMYEDAAMIRSIAEDGTELTVNVLPMSFLEGETASVPVHFQTGIAGEYTITASDLESFEYGTEIWLEDKKTGEDWVSLSATPEYTFTATPNDLNDRFEVHFFGPTGIDEFGAKTEVEIFANRNHAYLVNHTDELIKKVEVYTLSGGLVIETKVPDQKTHKLYINDEIGYYMVRVTTDKNIYTNKVFISF